MPRMTKHLNHEFGIKFFTDFDNNSTFKVVFEQSKSSKMKYWQEQKRTSPLQVVIRLM